VKECLRFEKDLDLPRYNLLLIIEGNFCDPEVFNNIQINVNLEVSGTQKIVKAWEAEIS
jgi:hypothetical protein